MGAVAAVLPPGPGSQPVPARVLPGGPRREPVEQCNGSCGHDARGSAPVSQRSAHAGLCWYQL